MASSFASYFGLRSTIAYTLTVSSLTVSTTSVKSIVLQSTMISLGQSTNQSYNNFTNGSFTTGWVSTLTSATSIKKVVLAPNGATQTILQNSGSTMSTVITSLNSGQTWAGSTMRGLPTSGALPYQTYGSTINAMPVPSITAITAAPSSGNQLAIASNELVYASANSGATFAATGLGQNNSPFIYMPFDGSVADVMGNATVTTTGSMAYVPGKVGTNALNLTNTAGGTASNYIDLITAPLSSFTASGWFNMQSFSATQSQYIFSGNGSALSFSVSTTGVCQFASLGVSITTSFTISTNTWYQFTVVFQSAGLCSLYINGSLIGQATGTAVLTAPNMRLGAISDFTIHGAFRGYICDFRLYNYAVTNPSGAALINPLVGPIMPFVYLTFDGSTTTDVMGNSTVTATGSPGFVAGQVGSNALDLSTNTAGGTAGKYLSGTWAGTSNFTVSGWFNAQAIPASSVAMIFSAGTGAATAFQVYITTAGILTVYSSAAYTTSTTITTGIWYFFQVVYQSSGTCHVYLNGTQVTTFSGTTLSPIPAIFNVGVYTHTAATGAFRGYIDDLRIYTGAFMPSQLSPVLYSPSHAIGSPNIYLPFENGSVLDAMGYSAVSTRGTMNFVPGVVGSSALNLVNPAGGTAVNYLRGSWAGSPNFTVSFWFNLQSLGVSYQNMFSSYNAQWAIDISSDRLELWYGGSRIVSSTLSLNTWYYTVGTFVANGTGELYLNGTRVGTYSCGATAGTSSGIFGIGTNDVNTANAGNIYIDDLKIYNCAVPFSALGPMNYTQAAISNSGAYQVVAAANGGVYTSANSGSTWSQATLAAPQPAAAVNTVGGQVITPNLTGLANSGTALTTPPWLQNGVSWVASASSIVNLGTFSISNLFNNTAANTNIWANSSLTYTTSGNSSGVNTVILGLGTATGDWAQIQSSVPLVMASYQFATGGSVVQLPKTYYIVGSNDGTAWYPIQYGSGGAVTSTAQYTLVPGVIIVNSASTQIFGSSTITTTTYSTTTNAYTYFRLIGLSNYNSSASYIELGEWYINFTTPATPLCVAPSTALIATQSLNAITVMPQQTGLIGNTTSSTPVTTTWTTANGVSWTASASSINSAGFQPWVAFNGVAPPPTPSQPYSWASAVTYSSGTYAGAVSTTILGVGAITGEWIQLQSSVPLAMNSYSYGCGAQGNIPKAYYIVGSNDGTNWYPIQYASMTVNPLTSGFTVCTSYLLVNQSGIQTIQGGQTGSGTFTTYSTTTSAYTYFRLIANTVFSGSNAEYTELFINFTAYTPALLQSLTVSPSGQYMALTGAGATAPNLTGLAANTWTANGVSWTASANTAVYPAHRAFNNLNASAADKWETTAGSYTGGSFSYAGTASTTIQTIGSVGGDWLQIQSSVPLVLASYSIGANDLIGRSPKTYYIVGSNDGSTWYPIQYCNFATIPFTTTYMNTSYITVNFSGTQSITAGQTVSATTTAYTYTTNSYIYFRIVTTNLFSEILINIGEWYLNFQSGPTFYSTDYGSSWTRSLSAATIPNANVLATSGNGQYSLQASGQTVFIAINTSVGNPTGNYTTPTFSPALTVNPVSNAAISATGQYMVVLIQSTTNNVYYSSNYGVSFTGITLGSTAMVSCAVSADGSYITVASATQVFTLNSNTQGLSITLGNQAGLTNQGQNAVAIGNQAGLVNQSANSIVLNSSGAAVNAYAPGFFVAPVQSAGSSVSSSFAILGHGSDNQVVQTGLTVLQNGNIGIGTTNPAQLLDITNAASLTPAIRLQNTYSAGYVSMGCVLGVNSYIGLQATNTISSALGTPTLVVANNGNVGIGTANPTSTLDINSNVSGYSPNISVMFRNGYGSTFGFVQKAGAGSYHSITQSGDTLLLSFDQGNNVTGANGIIIASWNQTAALRIGTTTSHFNGNVGINVAAPNAPLHVIGVATSGLSGNPPMSLINSSYSSVRWDIGPNTNGDLVIFYNNNGAWLGRGNPGAGWNLQSDLRLKDEIEPITHCLDKITALRPVSYRWKYNMDSPYKSFGLIAQEAKDVIPEMVNTLQDSTHGEIYGITYPTCIPILIGAVKELSYTISTLQEENAQMKSQMSSLQAANAATSSQMAALLAWAQAQGYS